MRTGLDASKGSHIIIQCADLSLDPEQVAQLIECAKKYPNDITSVSRHIKKGLIEEGYDKLKLIWNILSQKFLLVFYLKKLTDFTFGYRIVPTSLYHSIEWKELKHPFALEGTLKLLRLGIKFHEIPGRQQGGTQSGYAETLLYLPVALRIRFMRKSKILKTGAVIKHD